MKGVVFTEFLDFVAMQFGEDVVDDIISESALPSGGAYTSVGTYDHREMQTLVSALAARTAQTVPNLLTTFGRHLCGRFSRSHPDFFSRTPSLFDFLESVHRHIHVEVRKLYPDAELPTFETFDRTPERLSMNYRSCRPRGGPDPWGKRSFRRKHRFETRARQRLQGLVRAFSTPAVQSLMSAPPEYTDRLTRLEARISRERRARMEAEKLLEAKSLELYRANESLQALAVELEQRVHERTNELISAHSRAIDLVERDHLTGLVNRGRFMRSAEGIIRDCGEQNKRATIMVIDIDLFKEINDSFGHNAGDAVLSFVARELSGATAPADVVARLGGDEFCVVFPERGEDAAQALADRLHQGLLAPVEHAGNPIFVGASIGFAVFPDHGTTLDEVMSHADIALYESKRGGRGLCTGFNRTMREALSARQAVEAKLRVAIADRELEPWFQPIVNSIDRRVVGAEALVRWRRQDGAILAPGAFLGIAESCGMMPAIFSVVLKDTLRLLGPYVASGVLSYVTVNVSPTQFKFETLVQEVSDALTECAFPSSALVLEITEEVLMADFERARAQLHDLAELGIRIALDDFGSGYANIGYLRRLPVHVLKLDRSLTADVVDDPMALAIVQSVAALATTLGLEIVAEGIETGPQAQFVAGAGCDLLQGYLYAKPMPESDFATYLLRSVADHGAGSRPAPERCPRLAV